MQEPAEMLREFEVTTARASLGAEAAARAASTNVALAVLRLPAPYNAVIPIFASFGQAAPMSAPRTTPVSREYPDSMYVPAPNVAKGISLFGGAICVLSLIGTISTGFSLIHPMACLFGLIAATTFYTMGHIASKGARLGRDKEGPNTSGS